MGQVLGVEGLVLWHGQQVESGLLPVAQEQVFTNADLEGVADGGAVLHGVRFVMRDPVIVDA